MDIEALTTPFAQGAGENLRYEAVYDQIKDARIEEDATLSRGVWERDLKKADWGEVQRLCEEALLNRTKDLQLVAWLGDAVCRLDKWAGFTEALDLMTQFCHRCWTCCYPLTEDGQPDEDFRLRILEWFVERLDEHILFLPLTKPNALLAQSLDIATWQSAQNFDLVSKRLAGQVPLAPEENRITLSRFRTLIRQTDVDTLQRVQAFTTSSRSLTQALSAVWAEACHGQEPSLAHVNSVLAEIDKLCSFALEGRVVNAAETVVDPAQPPSPAAQDDTTSTSQEAILEESTLAEPPLTTTEFSPMQTDSLDSSDGNTVSITDRQGAYQAVNDLADYLIHLDPQTPGPYLLKMVSSWGEKSLPDILDDVTEGQTEGHRVLRMMVGVLQNRRA